MNADLPAGGAPAFPQHCYHQLLEARGRVGYSGHDVKPHRLKTGSASKPGSDLEVQGSHQTAIFRKHGLTTGCFVESICGNDWQSSERQANIQEVHLRRKSFHNHNVKRCCGVEKARRYFLNVFTALREKMVRAKHSWYSCLTHTPAHQKDTLPPKTPQPAHTHKVSCTCA